MLNQFSFKTHDKRFCIMPIDTQNPRMSDLNEIIGYFDFKSVLNRSNIIIYPTGASIVNIADYSPFGVQLDGRTISNGEYRYGFQNQEKDDEVKGEGNSYDFGARIYDPRVGRWLSLDAVVRKHSPFFFAGNNPLIFVDPSGDTEFYFNGKWIGTDGVDNNVIGIVTSKELKETIIASTDLGKPHSLGEIKNGTIGEGFIGIHIDVLREANSTLNTALAKGQYKEFSKILVDLGDGEIKKIYEHEGELVSLGSGISKVSSGADDAPVPENNKGISIHSHPTGSEINDLGNAAYCDAKFPSTGPGEDVDFFKDFDMNIIVGKNGKPSTSSYTNERGKTITTINDQRGGAINIFDKKSKRLATVSQKSTQTILKGDKGKRHKKYLKKQKNK